MTALSDLSCSTGVVVTTPGRAPAHLLVVVDSTVGKFALDPSMVKGNLVLTLLSPGINPVIVVIDGTTDRGLIVYKVHPANAVALAPMCADLVKHEEGKAHTKLADVLTVYRAVIKIKLRRPKTCGGSLVESLFTSGPASA